MLTRPKKFKSTKRPVRTTSKQNYRTRRLKAWQQSRRMSPKRVKKTVRKYLGRERRAIKSHKKKRFYRHWSFYWKTCLYLFLLGLVAGSITFFVIAKDLPSPEKIRDRQVVESTKIFDRTGEHLLYEIHGEEKRTIVSLDQISDYVKNATVAIEDDKFYKHHGIDFKGVLRAVVKDVTDRGFHEGASTITQQFIKNSILTKEKTLTRKLKEAILSIELERKFSKDQILEMYLNEIPYGSNAYGVEAAAKTFFDKSANEVTLAEAALLASLPQSTTRLSPYGSHKDDLMNRQKAVLRRMQEFGYITEEEREEAANEELEFQPNREGILAPHFVIHVREQIAEKFGEDFIEQEGLRVYTTLDYDKQIAAEEAVSRGAKNNLKFGASNAALVAANPKTGEVLAMVGSKDYFDEDIDGNVNVALALRQPGSSFKPFAYAKALEKGYTPDTLLFDVQTNFGADGSGVDYIPNNYDLKERGPVTIRTSLSNSLNITSVKTLYLAGIDETIELAQGMGINSLYNRDRFGLALVLGGGEVRLLDEVMAYGVFANEGIKKEKITILRIEDKTGEIIEEYKPDEVEDKEVLDKEVARQINSILSDNNSRALTFGPNSYLNIPGYQVAAKTGTTQEYRDAWTVGYTPSLVAGVWVGNNNNTPMRLAPGATVAAPIWSSFMRQALGDMPKESFTPPKKEEYNKMVLHGKYNEKEVRLCKIDDNLATDKVPDEETYTKTYKEIHNILHYVQKDDPQGDPPKNPEADPQYQAWEQEVQKWIKEEGISLSDIPTETCEGSYSDEDRPRVTITNPVNGATFENGQVSVKVEVESGRNMQRVEYFFDNELFGVDTDSPYEDGFNTRRPPGVYTLKVKAYDEIGSVGLASISVNLKNNNFVYLKKPNGSIDLSAINFPYTLEAIASHPDGVAKVNFFYKNKDGSDSSANLIGSVSAQGNNNQFSLVWQNMPGLQANQEDETKRELEIFTRSASTTGEWTKSKNIEVTILLDTGQ